MKMGIDRESVKCTRYLSRPKSTLKFILEIVQRIIKIQCESLQQLKCAKIKVK